MSGEPDAGERYRRAIGRTLADLRAEHEFSLRAMAEASGISLAFLSEIEHGQKEASGATLTQAAHAFRLTLPELLRAVAERLESEQTPPEVSLEELDRDEVDEVARFADWLRWRKTHSPG